MNFLIVCSSVGNQASRLESHFNLCSAVIVISVTCTSRLLISITFIGYSVLLFILF